MITEIILIIFAIVYYLFSTIFFASYISNDDYNPFIPIILSVVTMVVAPIATPVILGFKLGKIIKDN